MISFFNPSVYLVFIFYISYFILSYTYETKDQYGSIYWLLIYYYALSYIYIIHIIIKYLFTCEICPEKLIESMI